MMVQDWLLGLPLFPMALIIFGGTYLVVAAIWLIVTRLAVDDRGRAFKALSPGMLPPLGIIFGLLVGFTAAQVWSDFEKAKIAVSNEASALRSVIILSQRFPAEQGSQLRTLINEHIETAVNQEWPAMAQQRARRRKSRDRN
ncbi:MAG: bestrophin-like domain [Methyloceanibacter sp.]